jgi:hypothetical protein
VQSQSKQQSTLGPIPTIQPTDSDLPTALPTVHSATSIPDRTALPTVHSATSKPDDFARWYFTTLWKDRDYRTLWDHYLTPRFQSHSSDGDFQKYVEWWDSVDKIDINSVDIKKNDGKNTWIQVNVTFHMKDGRILKNRKYDYDLIYDENDNTWKFDFHN